MWINRNSLLLWQLFSKSKFLVFSRILTSKLTNIFIRSGKVKLPEWVDLVKTNVAKELAPFDEDWYYTRLASMARHIYIRSPVGVSTVCKIYGGKKLIQKWPIFHEFTKNLNRFYFSSS